MRVEKNLAPDFTYRKMTVVSRVREKEKGELIYGSGF